MRATKVIDAIKKYSKFLITSHISLEGDALGSELALASLLKKLGRQAFIVNGDTTPSNLKFLPGKKKLYHRLIKPTFEAVFIVDCPNKHRIGPVLTLLDDSKPIINIDHHIGNKKFGEINWCDPKASSAGEMVYRLFELTQTKLDKKDALNLYTAMLTDTGCFRYANTTSTTLLIASELLKFGIEPAKIYARIYENNSVQELIYMAKIISRMSFAANNKIAWIKINKTEFKRIKGKQELLDKVFDFARSINTVKVVIVFCQLNSRLVKLSFRSKKPIDVQKIALFFGGGGHKYASGCVIKGNIKEIEKRILKQVKRATIDC
jgi:phosphoesterase RecJ-like protein